MSRALHLLGPEGPLARGLVAYETRPGQLQMAHAVERALDDSRVLLCEAGTGTGKTLAYLVPAVLSGKKVVVSTATRALQEQIYYKDLPLVAKAIGREPRAALVKGLSNYLCKRRLGELRQSPEALKPSVARALAAIERWNDDTEMGDLAELASLREDDPVRLAVASSSETRLGPGCAHYDECFVTRMKREAESAQIVIVNHHLFFADLALRGPHPGRVLPDYDAVVFDEAHRLEDIATEFFGIRISETRLDRVLGEAERSLVIAGAGDPLFSPGTARLLEQARASARAFFDELGRSAPGAEPRATLAKDDFSGNVSERWLDLDAALEGVEALAAGTRGRLASLERRRMVPAEDALEATERRMAQLREQLSTVVGGGAGRVTWFERGARGRALSSAPVDLSRLLRERVFESVPSVILTSATLATHREKPDGGGAFGYVRARLGLDTDTVGVEELCVGSPFDFARQALLYTPRDLPPPASPAFANVASERVAELVRLTGGGCFVLTTSLRSMRLFHQKLVPLLPGTRVFVQGDAPKASLLAAFRDAGDAVLVATTSFWEGVDVPGRALRLVVLEKIPFLVPTDPVVRARAEALEASGKSSFTELHVPAATIVLKQGFGRLVRTRRDAGIVALLDERLHRRGYGKTLLAALPPAARTTDFGDVRAFWASHESPLHPEPLAATQPLDPLFVGGEMHDADESTVAVPPDTAFADVPF
ncbi:MAG TPA: ATP-dependent DNA helicase [Polyangiaceae bacterium]